MLKKGVFILVLFLWSAVQLCPIILTPKRKHLLLQSKDGNSIRCKITPYDHPEIQRKIYR